MMRSSILDKTERVAQCAAEFDRANESASAYKRLGIRLAPVRNVHREHPMKHLWASCRFNVRTANMPGDFQTM
jgi:hypothetical protein